MKISQPEMENQLFWMNNFVIISLNFMFLLM